ncbi:hypothetical protein JMJ77_0002050, partial [Colletotrichum scovillei]
MRINCRLQCLPQSISAPRTPRRMSSRCLVDSAPANDPPGSTHGTLVDLRGMVPYHAVGTIPIEARCLNGL